MNLCLDILLREMFILFKFLFSHIIICNKSSTKLTYLILVIMEGVNSSGDHITPMSECFSSSQLEYFTSTQEGEGNPATKYQM